MQLRIMKSGVNSKCTISFVLDYENMSPYKISMVKCIIVNYTSIQGKISTAPSDVDTDH